MEFRCFVSTAVIAGLLAPSVTPHGLAVNHPPKLWVLQAVTASSTVAIVSTQDLITGKRFTPVERGYRLSSILPST